MSITYDNLWILLSQKGLKRTDLCEKAGITTNVLAKMSKNESVHVEVLSKICGVLECTFDDIISNTGENSIISPMPIFKLDDSDVFEYSIATEFETLGLKTLKDFPKPHTANNIKKTLVRYIKECKLSIEAVNALLTELKKYNVIINIGEKIMPEYERIPKKFSNIDIESNVYQVEYQQVKNYIEWVLNEKQIGEALDLTSNSKKDIDDVSQYSSDSLFIIYLNNEFNYKTDIGKVNQNSYYPFNLLFDIFGYTTSFHYYFKYQYKTIVKKIDEVLSTLTPREEAIIRCIYEKNSISSDKIHLHLGLPDTEPIRIVVKDRYLRRALRKLRHPSRSKHIKNLMHYTSNTVIKLSDLTWHWSDELFNSDSLKILSSIVSFDYLIGVYTTQVTELNTRFIFVETLCKNNTTFHLLNIDTFGNMFEVMISEIDKESIESIIKNSQIFMTTRYGVAVEDMNLSLRTFNRLKASNFSTLEDIVALSENEIYYKVKNLGRKSLDELIEKLKKYGYYLNDKGLFDFRGAYIDYPYDKLSFAKYYSLLYSINNIEEEDLLKKDFICRCESLGFSLTGADWFIEMFKNTSQSINNIDIINKINSSQLLGSVIFKKWRYITHWSSGNLLSKENRIWFIVAFNRLYQICLEENSKK